MRRRRDRPPSASSAVSPALRRRRWRTAKSPVADLIADAQFAATQAAGARRAPTCPSSTPAARAPTWSRAPTGRVTYGQIFALEPFGNTLVVQTLTGAQLKALLEQQFEDVNGKAAVAALDARAVGGFPFAFDLSRPRGQPHRRDGAQRQADRSERPLSRDGQQFPRQRRRRLFGSDARAPTRSMPGSTSTRSKPGSATNPTVPAVGANSRPHAALALAWAFRAAPCSCRSGNNRCGVCPCVSPALVACLAPRRAGFRRAPAARHPHPARRRSAAPQRVAQAGARAVPVQGRRARPRRATAIISTARRTSARPRTSASRSAPRRCPA